MDVEPVRVKRPGYELHWVDITGVTAGAEVGRRLRPAEHARASRYHERIKESTARMSPRIAFCQPPAVNSNLRPSTRYSTLTDQPQSRLKAQTLSPTSRLLCDNSQTTQRAVLTANAQSTTPKVRRLPLPLPTPSTALLQFFLVMSSPEKANFTPSGAQECQPVLSRSSPRACMELLAI